MKIKVEFLWGFLVLAFAIFIVGLLAGMLAVGLVSLKVDSVALLMVFSLGFLLGVLVIALVLVSLRLLDLKRAPDSLH
ncbi:MAG: hypothetical protein QXG09_00055 [Candidatus Bathyarchaeia archaeon]